MKKTAIATLLLMVTISLPEVSAQRSKRSISKQTLNDSVAKIAQLYSDSLLNLSHRFASWRYTGSDTLSNPYYYPVFSPATFFTAPVRQAMALKNPDIPLRTNADTLISTVYDALNYVYATTPWVVRYDERNTGEAKVQEIAKDIKPEVNLSEKAPAATNDDNDYFPNDWDIVVRRPNFWKIKTQFGLKIAQTHVSDNWYKGGENNMNWWSRFYVEANYNNKQKVEWNNSLEMKLGFITSPSDKKHKFKANDDLIRLINKLGLRATKHWYYTISLQSWTQFYRGLRANDDRVYSDFMSPFYSDLSIGMEYKLNVKNFNLTANIAPVACKFTYVDRKYLATSFGLKENRHTKFDLIGSTVTINYTWNMFKNVSWRSRIYYFTNYKKALFEWENTFNLRINKYLSTELFLYPRFDDSVNRAEGDSYFQFREYLSVGLDISF